MPKKLGILVIHGIGKQSDGFSNALRSNVNEHLRDLNVNTSEIAWQEAQWADVLSGVETELMDDLTKDNPLRYMDFRNFVVHALGDAIAYQQVPGGREKIDVYDAIHRQIQTSLLRLRGKIRDSNPAQDVEAPLIIIAESLGCHIISNYIWDMQRAIGQESAGKEVHPPLCFDLPDNAFERMQTVSAIIMNGCNLPLFTLAYNDRQPINFPPEQLRTFFPGSIDDEDFNSAIRWNNYYDPDDILAYPLKPLSKKYHDTVHRDVRVNVGSIVTSATPLSHTKYWTDDDYTEPAAKMIYRVWRLLGP